MSDAVHLDFGKLFDKTVVLDAKGEASEQQQRLLHEHPIRWLHSLVRQKKAAEAHIASRRLRLRKLGRELGVGKPGVLVPKQYLKEKEKIDEANVNTVRFINGLSIRLDYVRQMIENRGYDDVDLRRTVEALAVARSILDHPDPEHGVEQCKQFLDDTLDSLENYIPDMLQTVDDTENGLLV